jgi:CBS-domain-containing membrane protein
MNVSDWLAKHEHVIVTVTKDTSLRDVISRLLEEPCLRDVYVTAEDGHLVGHISHKRLAEYLLAEHRPSHTRRQLMERVAGGTAGDFMNSFLVSALPDEQLDDVLNRQLEMELEDMPVIDVDGRVLGAVNLTHVLREYMRASAGETGGEPRSGPDKS